MIVPLETPLWLESDEILTFCMDWCCHYGQNCLFKFDFCWITNVVDYLNQNLNITKEKEKKF